MIAKNIKLEYAELVSNGYTLRGMAHIPKSSNDLPPIVITHGYFSSNKIGPHRLYVRLANFLAGKGYMVFRFDLSGMGESDGNIEDVSYYSHESDVFNIIKHVFDMTNKKVISIGHCIGGSLTFTISINNPIYFEQIILLAPFFTTPKVLENFFHDAEALIELKEKGFTYRKGLFSSSSFFTKNTTKENYLHIINKNNSAINVILAQDDQFIPIMESKELFNKKKINCNILAGADHNFLEVQDMLFSLIYNILYDKSKHLS